MRVAVVVDQGSRAYDVAVALEVFEDRTAHGLPLTQVRVCGAARTIELGAFSLQPDGDLASIRADVVVIPGQSRPGTEVDDDVLAAVQHAASAGSVVAALCTGAFVLGATGLLDGLEATTHWRWCEAFSERYPLIQVTPNVLYAGRGHLWTSAGVSAGTDLLLELTRRFHGSHVAAEVARSMVTPAHRPGSQAQFVPPARAAEPGALETVQQAMLAELAKPWTLAEIAAAAHLTERTTSRRFVRETGLAPVAWLTRARVIAAQELLETTDRTVEGVAHDVGLGSADLLRKHFRRQFGVSPLTHRQSMRAPES